MNRQYFIASAAGAAALGMTNASAAESSPVFVNTWSDSFPHLKIAGEVFAKSGSLMDAVEKAINAVEDDPSIHTVGYGGYPNADGEVELDAAIMNGTTHRAGSVCNLHTIKNPVSVARALMENTQHTTIAGAGALKFAHEMAFQSTNLLTPQARAAWEAWKRDPHHETYWLPGHAPKNTHDTVGVLGYDGKGHVVAGCSTSGIAWKIPGRVADSPLVGCGLYADDNIGAASATGDGDHMLRTDSTLSKIQAAVIAIDNRGNVGSAQMRSDSNFHYGIWKNGTSKLHSAPAIVNA